MTMEKQTLDFPLLPLKNAVLFPGMVMPLVVGRAASVATIEAASGTEEKLLVVVTQRDPSVEDPGHSDLHRVATKAVIKQLARGGEGVQVVVQGIERVEIDEVVVSNGSTRIARVRPLVMPKETGLEAEGLHRALLDQVAQVQEMIPSQGQFDLTRMISEVGDAVRQCYLLASFLSLDTAKQQALLEANTPLHVLQLSHEYLQHEVQVLKIRHQIASQAASEVSKEQRQYLLRQQLRAIQQELGEENPLESEVNELRNRLESAKLPPDVAKEAERELNRLEQLSPAAPDYQVTRTHLELLLELPWQATTNDQLDLVRAREILDEDHFNLHEVKDRIVEHLAVLKLNPRSKSPILCFVGPPGTGKTSLGQSIARALGRKFERLSLGGLHDEAELRGHRRTYIGAMPGWIIQAIRRAGVKNPLLMLDEVDKLGRDFRGDPAAALMEILDPAQNFAFRDNYLDVPFDLSNAFFIATANTLDTIPQPLLDRMEVLRLAGYSNEEKVQIARKYLIPRQLQEAGLITEQISIADEALAAMIGHYTREAGLRQLDRVIGRVCRKVATHVCQGRTEPSAIRKEDLVDILGPGKFFQEHAREKLLPGVATGLAWTEAGGDVLFVEAIRVPGEKGLLLTGQLGEVMQESAKAALSFVRSHAADLGIQTRDLRHEGVHIHVPAGATPKDGPSAGVAMVSVLASLFTNRPVRSDTAMTGEITLSGLVLPVGGIKEKVLAARRAGIRRIILPRQNERDLANLPEDVHKDLEFILADQVTDVLAAAIDGLPAPASLSAAGV